MYPTITEPELLHWLHQLQDGASILEGLNASKLDLLKALNAFIETRVSAAQFKSALVTSYIRGRKDEAEGAHVQVTVTYLLQACRSWIQENGISRQQFEAALLQMGYSPKGLKKKAYRHLAALIWKTGEGRTVATS
ncbi:MAG TPA: hypothetical protein IGR64_17305 [Leptolyngbyaceae cyanobacterium M65_K2018_010]|nr:hypothetical protein [Leptolyngbyaceae cyanobacterium M65_K2018_010]